MFHNALDIAAIVRQLRKEAWEIDPEELVHISPYLTEHIKRSASTARTNAASSRRRTRRSSTSTSPRYASLTAAASVKQPEWAGTGSGWRWMASACSPLEFRQWV
ncbi:hypothetical protein AB0C13_33905 [Streptomyces sp. NPDC049099]|uniref:hypothetical protein n=1 Tax=Streptomyces sp. NPDC049099 TaxID=3155768 RepID=UPI00342BE72C